VRYIISRVVVYYEAGEISEMVAGSLNLLSYCLLAVSQVWGQKQKQVTFDRFRNSLRNISIYPVCAHDDDCEGEHACFQYMCYPWKHSTGFRWCSKDSDCNSLTMDEEGDGENGRCFRHEDRENIGFGICLKKVETQKCWSHSDCPSHLKCTNGFCGDPRYFQALHNRHCEEDEQCEQLLTGEMCCFDTAAADLWKHGHDGWKKKCCNNPTGSPVIRPTQDLDEWEIKKLDKGISYLAPFFMDFLVCEGLSYEMMLKLSSCKPYRTTTTSTDRTNQMQHTGGGSVVVVGYSVVIAVIGYLL